jgi:hypothetical protein
VRIRKAMLIQSLRFIGALSHIGLIQGIGMRTNWKNNRILILIN